MSVTRRRSTGAADAGDARMASPGRTRTWRRVGQGALVVAAGTAALALAGPFALRPFVDAAQAAGTAGEVQVAFVLDFAGSGNQEVGCVTVPAGDSRYYALSAFLQQQGLSQPVYDAQGVPCSINGIPSTGCGLPSPGGIYWSYFSGSSGGWTYEPTSAAGGTVGSSGDVEGWRLQDPGTGGSGDPAPRTTPRYDAICASTTPTTTTHGGGGGNPGGGQHRHRAHASKHGSASTTAAAAPAGVGARSTATTGTSTTTTSTYPSDDSSTDSVPPVSVPPDPEVGLANARHASSGSSGPGPDPLIIGGLLVAALAVLGFTRWRKRPKVG